MTTASNTEPFVMHPGHALTVTVGPVGQAVGRAWVDCTCGLTRVHPTKSSATRTALQHHHDVGGCSCPPQVREHPDHPAPPAGDAGAPLTPTSETNRDSA